jgi:hypothetical protein
MLRYPWQVSNVFHGSPAQKKTFALEPKHAGKSNSMKSDTIRNLEEIIFK